MVLFMQFNILTFVFNQYCVPISYINITLYCYFEAALKFICLYLLGTLVLDQKY